MNLLVAGITPVMLNCRLVAMFVWKLEADASAHAVMER